MGEHVAINWKKSNRHEFRHKVHKSNTKDSRMLFCSQLTAELSVHNAQIEKSTQEPARSKA